MTWGYESHVTLFFAGPTSQNTFCEHARDLLFDLKRARLGEEKSHRPLLFVAHSLGGKL